MPLKQTNGKQSSAPAPAAHPAAPRGRQLVNLSPGKLNPGAGKRTAATQEAEFCGQIWGIVMGFEEIESTRYPGTRNLIFYGTFGFKNAAGVIGRGTQAYLPSIVAASIKAPLVQGQQGVPFRFELWTGYDPRPDRVGFFYDVYEPELAEGDAIDALGISAGFLPPPPKQVMMTHQGVVPDALDELLDEETGELTRATAGPQAADRAA